MGIYVVVSESPPGPPSFTYLLAVCPALPKAQQYPQLLNVLGMYLLAIVE